MNVYPIDLNKSIRHKLGFLSIYKCRNIQLICTLRKVVQFSKPKNLQTMFDFKIRQFRLCTDWAQWKIMNNPFINDQEPEFSHCETNNLWTYPGNLLSDSLLNFLYNVVMFWNSLSLIKLKIPIDLISKAHYIYF